MNEFIGRFIISPLSLKCSDNVNPIFNTSQSWFRFIGISLSYSTLKCHIRQRYRLQQCYCDLNMFNLGAICYLGFGQNWIFTIPRPWGPVMHQHVKCHYNRPTWGWITIFMIQQIFLPVFQRAPNQPLVHTSWAAQTVSDLRHRPIIATFNLLCRFLICCCFEPRATQEWVWLKNWCKFCHFLLPVEIGGTMGKRYDWVNFWSSA